MRAAPLRCALLAALVLAATGCQGRGREVFIREGCVQCHRFRGLGGGEAPDLSAVSKRLDAASIKRQITRPGVGNPASRMPAFPQLSWFDLASLVAFLRG